MPLSFANNDKWTKVFQFKARMSLALFGLYKDKSATSSLALWYRMWCWAMNYGIALRVTFILDASGLRPSVSGSIPNKVTSV